MVAHFRVQPPLQEPRTDTGEGHGDDLKNWNPNWKINLLWLKWNYPFYLSLPNLFQISTKNVLPVLEMDNGYRAGIKGQLVLGWVTDQSALLTGAWLGLAWRQLSKVQGGVKILERVCITGKISSGLRKHWAESKIFSSVNQNVNHTELW